MKFEKKRKNRKVMRKRIKDDGDETETEKKQDEMENELSEGAK